MISLHRFLMILQIRWCLGHAGGSYRHLFLPKRQQPFSCSDWQEFRKKGPFAPLCTGLIKARLCSLFRLDAHDA